MKSNYRSIPQQLRNCEPFKGNSMSAYVEEESGIYYVKSYDTVIAYANPIERDASGSWDYSDCDKWVTEKYYSRTTSRHVNLCNAWLPNRKFTGNMSDLAQIEVTEDGRILAR